VGCEEVIEEPTSRKDRNRFTSMQIGIGMKRICAKTSEGRWVSGLCVILS
jgi:hypothetical protein